MIIYKIAGLYRDGVQMVS